MSRIRSGLIFVAAVGAIVVSGCGGGGGQGSNPGPVGDAFVLQKTVFVVPTDGTVSVSAVDANSVTLTGSVPPNVVVGWTLVGNKVGATQFLRKVTSLAKSGGKTVFQTTPARLPDIFNDAQIHHMENVAASVLATMKSPLPGVTFGVYTAKPGATKRDIAYSNKITFSKTGISDAGGLNSVGTINGELDYSFGFETALDVGVHGIFDLRPKINKFRVAPFLKANGNLTVTGTTHGSFTKTITIGSPISFPIASIGPVPINLNLQFNLELDGTLDVNGVLQVTGAIDMSAGIDCTNDNWSTIQTFNHSFAVTPPSLKAQATLTLSAAQPQVGVSIPDSEPFNRKVWISQDKFDVKDSPEESARFRMIDDVSANLCTLGSAKSKIVNLLGNPNVDVRPSEIPYPDPDPTPSPNPLLDGAGKREVVFSAIGYALAEDPPPKSGEIDSQYDTILALGFDKNDRLCWKGLIAE